MWNRSLCSQNFIFSRKYVPSSYFKNRNLKGVAHSMCYHWKDASLDLAKMTGRFKKNQNTLKPSIFQKNLKWAKSTEPFLLCVLKGILFIFLFSYNFQWTSRTVIYAAVWKLMNTSTQAKMRKQKQNSETHHLRMIYEVFLWNSKVPQKL